MHRLKVLRYGPHVTRGSHSFTCHPHMKHTCLYFSAARHQRPLAGTDCAYPRRDAKLSWPGWLVTYQDKMSRTGNWTWTRSPIQVLTGPDVGYLPLIESNALSLQQTTTPPVYHQYAVTTAESCICQLLMFCSHCFVLCRHECITVLGRLLIMSVSTICSLRSDIFIHVPLSPIPSPATTTWTYKNLLITV